MYSNFIFQFLEKASVFLGHHNDNINILISLNTSSYCFIKPLNSLSIIIKILRLIQNNRAFLETLIFNFFSFLILSTSLDLFCNFQKTFEIFEKTKRCTQILFFNFLEKSSVFLGYRNDNIETKIFLVFYIFITSFF